MTTSVGVLGHGALACVDDRGAVVAGDLTLDWWIGADDRWHVPAAESATRQDRAGPAPMVETRARVPGGDVVQRTYGAAAPTGPVVVVEVENRSPVPLTVGLVVRITCEGVVELDDAELRVGGAPVLAFSRRPGACAVGAPGSGRCASIVTGGEARTPPLAPVDGPIELALLFPVPHRTCIRAALAQSRSTRSRSTETQSPFVDVRALPSSDAVSRGWERQLERGLQAELPAPIGGLVDAARADLLLAPRRDPGVVAALEDWGFDDEAERGWAALGWRARRRERRRDRPSDPWSAVRATDASGSPARFLSALRAVLVRETPDRVELLPGFPPEWLGQSLTVGDLPLRSGLLSFAIRWHGARPALLWDAPAGLELRAPGVDARWSSSAAVGEALLAEPTTLLLPMGGGRPAAGSPSSSPGAAIDASGQFS